MAVTILDFTRTVELRILELEKDIREKGRNYWRSEMLKINQKIYAVLEVKCYGKRNH